MKSNFGRGDIVRGAFSIHLDTSYSTDSICPFDGHGNRVTMTYDGHSNRASVGQKKEAKTFNQDRIYQQSA